MRLSFTVEGDKEVVRYLETKSKKARRLKRPLQDSADYMLERINKNFSGTGSLWGRWKRRSRSYPWRLLDRTGAMRRGFRDTVTNRQAEISNTQPYFKYHQSRYPRKYLPRRVMMAINTAEATEIVRIFQRHIKND